MPTEKGKVSKVHIDEGKNRYGLLVNTKWYGGFGQPTAEEDMLVEIEYKANGTFRNITKVDIVRDNDEPQYEEDAKLDGVGMGLVFKLANYNAMTIRMASTGVDLDEAFNNQYETLRLKYLDKRRREGLR